MRMKVAEVKIVDNKFMCTECLTRYDSKYPAFDCAEQHNKRRVLQANSIMESILKNRI